MSGAGGLIEDQDPTVEQRVLIEMMRMFWTNVCGSIIAALVLITFLIAALGSFNSYENLPELMIWGTGILVMRISGILRARHLLTKRTLFSELKKAKLGSMMASAVSGATWGALVWVAPTTSGRYDDILVIALLAGVISSSMSVMAPVRSVFLSFGIGLVVTMATKLLVTNSLDHYILAFCGIIYIVGLYAQAGVMAKAAASSVELRFENQALIEKLGVEIENAKAAQSDAAAANLAKSKFLAAASHDLRQPVHALGLFLEVLGRGPLSLTQRNVLSSARKASEASAEMLNTLLDFSRIEAGVIEPQLKAFALQPLLNKIENELAQQADIKSITYRSRETDLVAWSDPTLIDLILRNFVSNAIRYTEHGGVLVGCRRRGAEVVVEVWDTGIGIAADHQEAVFREFHQLGNAERDRRNGLGLGLSIAYGLAKALGHRLSLSSEPGRGTVFRLVVPVSKTAPRPSADDLAPTGGAFVGLTQVRVLIIDDDEAVRHGMCALLVDWGFECDAVESIEEALAVAAERPPGLVISDYRLRNGATGAHAIATIRSKLGQQLPALLITGDTAPERLREARASGVPLLHKPVSPGQLYRRLSDALAPARAGEAAG